MATNVDDLIKKIKSPDDQVRSAAWQNAAEVGAPAVKPLAAVMTDENIEIARAAKRGLWVIVRHAGRPGADDEKSSVVAGLLGLLGDDQPTAVRREALWMISELYSGCQGLGRVAQLLGDKQLREDARCCLERMPHKVADELLKRALEAATDDFKYALARSLRVRGVEVDQKKYPCQKLVPTAQTQVKPVGR